MNAEEIKKAKLRALGILTRLDKTESELESALKRAGFSLSAVNEALEYVKSYGYLDDKKYAVKYVDCYKDRKSRKKIKYDLIKKGVDKQQIEDALERYQDYDETVLIKQMLYKKWKSDEKPDEKELRRLFSSLARQGFSSHDIWQVLHEENLT